MPVTLRENNYCLPISTQFIRFINFLIKDFSLEEKKISIVMKPKLTPQLLGGFHPVDIEILKVNEEYGITKLTEYCIYQLRNSTLETVSMKFDLQNNKFYSIGSDEEPEPLEDKRELYEIWENELLFLASIQKVYNITLNSNP